MVEAEELSGGDFVRTMKQLIDVLRQLALVAPDARHATQSPNKAADQLFRGVVAASSAIEVVDEARRRRRSHDERRDDDPQG